MSTQTFNVFETNRGLIDWWSLSHLTSGFIGGAVFRFSLPTMLILTAIWEAFEWWGKANEWPAPWIHPAQDTAIHLLADFSVMMLGWYIGKTTRKVLKAA